MNRYDKQRSPNQGAVRPGGSTTPERPSPVDNGDVTELEHKVAHAHQELGNAITGAQEALAAIGRAQSDLSGGLARLDNIRSRNLTAARSARSSPTARRSNITVDGETAFRLARVQSELLTATNNCRPDMHEPDEQDVTAVVTGYVLDNAMGADPAENCGELTVGIKREVGYDGEIEITWINLADLIALARMATIV